MPEIKLKLIVCNINKKVIVIIYIILRIFLQNITNSLIYLKKMFILFDHVAYLKGDIKKN
jgi:hypothetical protein